MSRRVLLSGALGYIGGHVWQALLEASFQPIALVRAASVDKALALGLQSDQLCVLDPDPAQWAQQLAAFGAVQAIHLAAGPAGLPFVGDDVYAQVLVQLHLPLCMAQAVLRSAAPGHVPSLVVAGSHWQRVGGQEGNALNVYAAHKTALEQSLKPLAERDGLRVRALRLGDVYGPCDPRGKFLSLLAAASHSGETLALSPGQQRLDWVHVNDVAKAFVVALLACALPTPAAAFPENGSENFDANFSTHGVGTGHTHSLREVLALWNAQAQRPCAVQWGGRPYREREVMQTDVGPLLPGWQASIGLEQGLRQVLAAHGLAASPLET